MIKRLIVFLVFLLLTGTAFSQIDNRFWFVAPDISQTHGDSPIYIRLSSMSEPVNYLLTMPADPGFAAISGSMMSNQTSSIDLTPFLSQIENSPPDQVNTKGLLLTTDNPVTAYYEEANSSNPGIFSLKGQNALGLEFYIVSQNSYPNHGYSDAFESFEIVATENNTSITIIPTDDVVGYSAYSTISVTLNRGETYCVRAINQQAANTLAGSHIVSDKPVAVTWADDSVETGGWDLVGDQIVPVSIIGTEYIAIKGFANNTSGDNEERIFIVGTAPGTDVSIDGTLVQTIGTGELFTYPIPPASATAYVQTSLPAYLLHLSGFPGETGASLLPQIFCTGSQQIGFYRTAINQFALMILTPAGNEGFFTMDGSSTIILASDFSVVPGTAGAWVFARKTLSPTLLGVGSHLIANSQGKFHLGIINQLGGSSEYGYFSYFSSMNLGVDRNICPGSSITLNAGPGWTTYMWEKEIGGVWTAIGGNTQTFNITDPGHYRCSVAGQSCTLQDDVVITMYPLLEPGIVGDASVCINESNVPYSASGNFAAYDWNITGGTLSGQGTSAILAAWITTGSQSVTLSCTDENGCTVQKVYPVEVHPLPVSTIAAGGPTTFCQGGSVALTAAGGTSYLWSNAATTDMITVTTTGIYVVTVTDANGCSSSTAQTISVNPLPVPTITPGGPTTFCQGGSVSLTASGGSGFLWSTSATTAGISITTGNTYVVTVTDANGCVNTAAQPVVVNPLPVTAIVPGGPTAFCQGGSVNLAATGGTTYLWSTTATTAAIIVSSGGTYVVTVTDANGCMNTSSQAVVVQSLPVASILPAGPTTFCQGGSVQLNASGGTGYLWSTGATTGNISVASSGIFAVTVTDGNGCKDSESIQVIVNPLPVTSFTGAATVCQADMKIAIPLKYLYPADPGPSAAYSWSITPASHGTIDNAAAAAANIAWNIPGTATLRLDAQTPEGCTSFTTRSVTVQPVPDVALKPCNDPATTTTSKPFALKGGTPYNGQYYINGNLAAGGMLTQTTLPPGNYQVIYAYTNANGCANTSSPVTIKVIAGTSLAICPATFTDPRDQQSYSAAAMGGRCWMLVNLNYADQKSAGLQPQSDDCTPEKYCPPANPDCNNYGGLYQWDELMQYQFPPAGQYLQGLCPPEWHVPSAADWQQLIDANQGNAIAAGTLQDAVPVSGFRAVLQGVNYLNLSWSYTGAANLHAAMFWTSTLDGGKPVARGMNDPTPSVSSYGSSKANAFAVRCIRDF